VVDLLHIQLWKAVLTHMETYTITHKVDIGVPSLAARLHGNSDAVSLTVWSHRVFV